MSKMMDSRIRFVIGSCVAAIAAAGCTATRPLSSGVNYAAVVPATQSAAARADAEAATEGQSDEEVFAKVVAALGKTGKVNNSVYTVTVPRDDLSVSIEGMYVPTEAGIESTFRFYHCSCGKTTVIGAFCVTDYELNDVIDTLRAGNIEIASTSPMFIRTQANPLVVRFQGEGAPDELGKTIAAAMRLTGRERNAPNPAFRK